MRILLLILLLALPDRALTLSREMLEDAIIRDDADGIALARERLLRVAAEADGATLRDAHTLIALSAYFESFSPFRDAGTSGRIAAMGLRHADRALQLDPQCAEAWMLSSSLRWTAQRAGRPAPPDAPGAPNRYARSLEIDAKAPAVAFTNGIIRSFNPDGPAHPEGVRVFDEFAERMDAERAATGRRFGLWDAEAHAWTILVRMASADPGAETLRPLSRRLMNSVPISGSGR